MPTSATSASLEDTGPQPSKKASKSTGYKGRIQVQEVSKSGTRLRNRRVRPQECAPEVARRSTCVCVSPRQQPGTSGEVPQAPRTPPVDHNRKPSCHSDDADRRSKSHGGWMALQLPGFRLRPKDGPRTEPATAGIRGGQPRKLRVTAQLPRSKVRRPSRRRATFYASRLLQAFGQGPSPERYQRPRTGREHPRPRNVAQLRQL